jgi:hypothetical protein
MTQNITDMTAWAIKLYKSLVFMCIYVHVYTHVIHTRACMYYYLHSSQKFVLADYIFLNVFPPLRLIELMFIPPQKFERRTILY